MKNGRLIPSLPDELGLQVLANLSPDPGPSRWHYQPSRRDFDPDPGPDPDPASSQRQRYWIETYPQRRAVWTSAGRVCRSWRVELKAAWGSDMVVGTWPGAKGFAPFGSFVEAQEISRLAISFLDVPFHAAWSHIDLVSLSPLPSLTSLTVLAPPDLSGLFPLLLASPCLRHLCIVCSALDAPGRRFTQGLPILASSPSPSHANPDRTVPYALDSFELVVDGGSVPYSAELSTLFGRRTALSRLSVSFKDPHGTFWSKVRLHHVLVETLDRFAPSLEDLQVDDWDQDCPLGLLHCPQELPMLPELKRLVLGGAGLPREGLDALGCSKLVAFELDDLRRTFEHDLVDALQALSDRTAGRLERVYLAGDALDGRRDDVQAWAKKQKVRVEWGQHIPSKRPEPQRVPETLDG